MRLNAYRSGYTRPWTSESGTGGSNCIILGDSLREQPGFETQLVWPVTGLDAQSVVDR